MNTENVIYCDGGCRGNGTDFGEMYGSFRIGDVTQRLTFWHGTNNQAEYLTLIDALQFAKDMKLQNPVIYSDSQLIVNQVNGEWRVKNVDLIPLRDKAYGLLQEVNGSLRWVRRDVIVERLGH